MIPAARLLVILAVLPAALAAQRIDIAWPTPSTAWERGAGIESFVQPTVSGVPESGLFGCVRSNGLQFHEGIDIKPVRRDARGEAADTVTAAMAGVVRHINTRPGESSYGRYVVLEHPDATPAVYTLYAHLARVDPGLRVGARVEQGRALGLMGRSAGGYAIPRERAHLHFEIGLRTSDSFQSWYTWRKFGSPNQHGVWNGMNLLGIDPLDFMRQWKSRRVDNFQQYFDRMRPAVRVRVVTSRTPDFVTRYPALLSEPMPVGMVGGWEVEFNATGLPYSWKPLPAAAVAGLRADSVQLLQVDAALTRGHRCKNLVRPKRGGGHVTGPDLDSVLQLLFGLRG
ncbi:MAG TPA: M23 family metallopeptidase [Opitutaceae bacterium]|nr:M23 family metallopeptidase [Opitutaceae bacterium]